MFKKKYIYINKTKQKNILGKISLKAAIISNLVNFDQNILLVLVLIKKYSIFNINIIDIDMISIDIYYIVYYLKKFKFLLY